MVSRRAKDFYKFLRSVDSFTDGQAKVADWDCDCMKWVVIDITPTCGPYRGAKITFKMELPVRFPRVAPTVSCSSNIYHPNIDPSSSQGNVCLNLTDEWQEHFGLEDCIQGMLFLLNYPNLEDPLSPFFSGEAFEDDEEFPANVRLSLMGREVDGFQGERLIPDEVVNFVRKSHHEDQPNEGGAQGNAEGGTDGEPTPAGNSEGGTDGEPTPAVNSEGGTDGEPTLAVNSEDGTDGEPTLAVNSEDGTDGEPTPAVISEGGTDGEPTPAGNSDGGTDGEPNTAESSEAGKVPIESAGSSNEENSEASNLSTAAINDNVGTETARPTVTTESECPPVCEAVATIEDEVIPKDVYEITNPRDDKAGTTDSSAISEDCFEKVPKDVCVSECNQCNISNQGVIGPELESVPQTENINSSDTYFDVIDITEATKCNPCSVPTHSVDECNECDIVQDATPTQTMNSECSSAQGDTEKEAYISIESCVNDSEIASAEFATTEGSSGESSSEDCRPERPVRDANHVAGENDPASSDAPEGQEPEGTPPSDQTTADQEPEGTPPSDQPTADQEPEGTPPSDQPTADPPVRDDSYVTDRAVMLSLVETLMAREDEPESGDESDDNEDEEDEECDGETNDEERSTEAETGTNEPTEPASVSGTDGDSASGGASTNAAADDVTQRPAGLISRQSSKLDRSQSVLEEGAGNASGETDAAQVPTPTPPHFASCLQDFHTCTYVARDHYDNVLMFIGAAFFYTFCKKCGWR